MSSFSLANTIFLSSDKDRLFSSSRGWNTTVGPPVTFRQVFFIGWWRGSWPADAALVVVVTSLVLPLRRDWTITATDTKPFFQQHRDRYPLKKWIPHIQRGGRWERVREIFPLPSGGESMDGEGRGVLNFIPLPRQKTRRQMCDEECWGENGVAWGGGMRGWGMYGKGGDVGEGGRNFWANENARNSNERVLGLKKVLPLTRFLNNFLNDLL